MADDSELDYIRTFLTYACPASTVKHFSEVKKIAAINNTRRVLVFPGELIGSDGNFYTKRYKVQISETSEVNMMASFNNIIDEIMNLSSGQQVSNYYTGVHFDVITEALVVQGICWDGTNFWIICSNTEEVYQYTREGIYTGVHFDVNAEDVDPQGICWDGANFWVIGQNTKEVYQYTSEGVYTTVHFDVGTEDASPTGICWDGTNFWVIGATGDEVFKYTSDGTYTTTHFDVGTEDASPTGICWDGTNFWVIGAGTDEVYQYNSGGVYTTVHFDVNAEDTDPTGICWDGAHLWVVGLNTDEAYQYNRSLHSKPSVLCYISLAYGSQAEEAKTKRWYQDIYLDVEWCTS